jgi:response regulator of citrate/malate metabolism
MTRKGVKNGTGVHHRIVEFFAANPDEELTIDDIAAKFGCTKGTARVAVHRASERGQVVRPTKALRP